MTHDDIREFRRQGATYHEIATLAGLSQTHVYAICRGLVGMGRGRGKRLSRPERETGLMLLEAGVKRVEVARELHVSLATVRRLANRKLNQFGYNTEEFNRASARLDAAMAALNRPVSWRQPNAPVPHVRKLTRSEVIHIRVRLEAGSTVEELSRAHHVSRSTIYKIKNRTLWG